MFSVIPVFFFYIKKCSYAKKSVYLGQDVDIPPREWSLKRLTNKDKTLCRVELSSVI